MDVHFPYFFTKFEEIKNKNSGDFLVGKQLTWVDLLLATQIEFFEQTVDPKFVKAYPALCRLKETVYDIPQIKKWVQERPTSDR